MSGYRFNLDAFLQRFDVMDAQLVARGFHSTSAWWRAEFERFLRSGRRRWVIRAGRRAGKSSFLCRLAVAWSLWGPWSVPAGDVAVIPFVSVDRDEASARIRTVKDIIAALGISADVRGDEIELKDRVCIFRVETCSIRSVGFTAVMLVGDEMARWESRDSAANPAKEVMGSIRPTMATIEQAFEVCSSSPWGEDDYHAELFAIGNTEHQCVSAGTTWECNPTISESRTHQLEPDEKVWSREYANVPGGTVSAALDSSDYLACVRTNGQPVAATSVEALYSHRPAGKYRIVGPGSVEYKRRTHAPGAVLELTAQDARELGATVDPVDGPHEVVDKRAPKLVIDSIAAFDDSDLRRMAREGGEKKLMSLVVEQISDACKAVNVRAVFGDQRESAALESLFGQQGISFTSIAWSEPSKDRAFQMLRRMLRERELSLPNHETLRKEATSCKAHLRPSGRTFYATNGLDYLSAVVTMCHAIEADLIGSGAGFCCIDASSLRGDAFAYLLGHSAEAKSEPIDPDEHIFTETRWSHWPTRGY